VTAAPSFRARWAAAIAVAGGLLGVLAFPRYGWWPTIVPSVAALSVAVHGRTGRRGAWLGYLYGLAFLLPLLHWTGVYVGPIPWLILCIAFAGFFALLGGVLACVQRLRGAPFWIAAAWVLQEYLRDRIPFGGFPWGRLAFSQAASPLRWFAPLGGAPLVTFAVALSGGALAVAVARVMPLVAVRRFELRAARPLAAALALTAAAPLLGIVLGGPLSPSDQKPSLRIALIQGGLPDLALKFESRERQVLDNHVEQTLTLARQVEAGTTPKPDLVLWPEDASDVDPLTDALARAEITRAVKAVGVPILVGAILPANGGRNRLNVGILWSPTNGPGAQYVKRHPVPFGEYIPLRSIAEAVSSDAKTVTNDMIGGHGNGLLKGAAVPFGDVICFEVAYDSLVQSSIKAGAQFLVVQTNNATFGHTPETYQQLAMSRLRAVETGREVLQVATTGKSAIIDPDGQVVSESGPLFAPAILTGDIAPRTALTLAVRVGAWPEEILTLAAVGAFAFVLVQGRRRRRREATPEAGHRDEQPAPDADADSGEDRRQEEMVQA
jgi:apolipoprotein N-acyltransferase